MLGKVNSMSTYLGALTDSWKQFEASYLENIFSGQGDSLDRLERTIAYGGMNRMINDLNLTAATNDLQKLVYGQLLNAAWKLDTETARPFIWYDSFHAPSPFSRYGINIEGQQGEWLVMRQENRANGHPADGTLHGDEDQCMFR